MMNRRALWVLPVVMLGTHKVFAQTKGSPARLRGKIDALSGNTLQLTLRSGDKTSALISADTRIVWLKEAPLSQIQQGSYIGTAAIAQLDGSLKALEVQVFPPSMRGVGEGTRDWDLGAGSSMTNGTVGSMVATNGRTITITYKGGEKHVLVPDNVPIVTYEPADRSALTAGANVLVNGMLGEDSKVVAASISVGRNGLVPPM